MISEKLEQLIRKIVLEETTKIKHGKLTEEKKYEISEMDNETREFGRIWNELSWKEKHNITQKLGYQFIDSDEISASTWQEIMNGKDQNVPVYLIRYFKQHSREFLGENKYKLSKGNKSTKNSFGNDKLKDTNSNPRQEFEDYPISYEEGMEKLKGIKDKDKLDREYEKIFAQMNNSHERNLFRGYYKILRDNLNQKR